MINAIRNPDVYHGKNKKSNFFEGWYFKLVQPHTGHTYCFIPGVFISSEEEHCHSFIQVLKGNENNYKYLRFKKEKFKAGTEEFQLDVDKSSFSLNKISLNIAEENEKIFGTLYFENVIKWPDSIINPGSMGFYNYLCFMECYSQVCAVDGLIRGKLNINDEVVDFTGGKLYIEKNWGKSFPYSYVWVQGNSFKNGEGSVTCSIAHIPFPVSSFTGFLIGIYAKGRFYKFTTINRSKLLINCENEKMVIETYNKEYILKIETTYNKETFMNLYAPRDGTMIPVASESLNGNLRVTLYDKKSNSMIFNDTCSSAGVEFSEDYLNLISRI